MMGTKEAYDRLAREIRMRAPRSRRDADGMTEMIRLATLAASSHNTQPWRFHVDGTTVTIRPDYSRRCPVVDPDDSHLFKSLGCAAENLVQAAPAHGYRAHARTEAEADRVVVELEPSATARPSALSDAIPRRQCTRGPYNTEPVKPTHLHQLEEAGRGQGVHTRIITAPREVEAVAELVAEGNRAQLSDPAFRAELAAWIRFNCADALRTRDGLAGRAGGRPGLPDWLARRLLPVVLTPKGQAETDRKHIRSSAGLAVFVADREDKVCWVEAGRAYERFALRAASLDIRNAFVNQPIEVHALRPLLASALHLGDAHPMLLVRFGLGPALPYSLRRPVEEVMGKCRV